MDATTSDTHNSPVSHFPQKQTALSRSDLLPALLQLLNLKDQGTRAHVNRVYALTQEWLSFLQKKMNILAEDVEMIEVAALLHDIGKVGVLDEILQKKDSLTTFERDHLEQHPEIGYQLIRDYPGMGRVAESIRHHHERFDGRGYPLGLKENQIPFGARIIAIVDTFDAIISERPYKLARPVTDAMEEIKKEAGRQFCPELSAQFIQFMHSRNT